MTAALAAGAHYLVSHDTHFDVLKQIRFPRLPVITAEELQTLLRDQAGSPR